MTKIISFYNLIGVLCKMDAEENNFRSFEEETQNLVSNTDKFVKIKEDTIIVFNCVANQKYPEGMSREQKKEFRRKCKCYVNVLYYVGFGKKGKNIFNIYQSCVFLLISCNLCIISSLCKPNLPIIVLQFGLT